MRLLSPVITKSGWIYGVAAPWNQGQDLIGYPMYYPKAQGARLIGGREYEKFLRRNPTECATRIQPYTSEPRIDPWTCRIPHADIEQIIDVTSAFQEWIAKDDPRKSVINQILREASIPIEAVGLGGSMSLGCAKSDGDVDILIFGTSYGAECIRSIEHVLATGQASLMPSEVADGYSKRYSLLYDLPPQSLFHIFAQDLTKIYVGENKISFIFAYSNSEWDQIPDALYQPQNLGTVKFQARIVSNISSWYYPRKYVVQTQEGSIHTIWSHHWIHKAAAPIGTLVSVSCEKIDSQIHVLSKLSHCIMPIHSASIGS